MSTEIKSMSKGYGFLSSAKSLGKNLSKKYVQKIGNKVGNKIAEKLQRPLQLLRIQKLLKPSLCDYSNAYILVNRTIAITGTAADALQITDERNKKVTFKNWTPFTNCINQINNT